MSVEPTVRRQRGDPKRDSASADEGRLETPVRPVRCWYCGQQMHYSGHVAHEPEVRLTLDTGDTEEILYLHTRCWNDWQQRRRGDDEYEAGYERGLRDARA